MDTLGSSTPLEQFSRLRSVMDRFSSPPHRFVARAGSWGSKPSGWCGRCSGTAAARGGAPRRSQHLQREGREEEVPGRPTAELYHRLQPCHASEPPNRRHGLPRPRAAAIPPIRCGTRAIDEACSVIMVCAAPAAARRALAGCLTAAHGGGGRSRSSRAAQRSTSSISAAECANLASAGFAHCANPANVVILTSRSM